MSTDLLNRLNKSVLALRPARALVAVAVAAMLGAPLPATAQTGTGSPLVAASDAIESLVQQVSGGVVQVIVTGLHPVASDEGAGPGAVGRGRNIGAGFVVDHGGYIITNAHVVAGAERIDVVATSAGNGQPSARTLPAAIVGVAEEWDLALIKVDDDLPPLALSRYDSVRQGQLVFAFGSPDGLRNSVSMGMVSAVARQVDVDSPLVYIQTDAAINPGSSGGPLVNVKGEVIGINTLIRTASGGSDGLGFALPGDLVALAYPQLRDLGRVRRAVIGVATQTVTPLIAEGLRLPPISGLIVSDVAAGSPAERAGITVGDILTSIDGEQVDTAGPSRLYLHLAALRPDADVVLTGVRAGQPFRVKVTPVELPYDDGRASVIDTGAMAVEPLAILGVPYRTNGTSGIMVAARLDTPQASAVALNVGDVVRAVNGVPVDSVLTLRQALSAIAPRHAVVLQVLQAGRLVYVAFERE